MNYKTEYEKLVQYLGKTKIFSPNVIEAFVVYPRYEFLSQMNREEAGYDRPVVTFIEKGVMSTNSQPSTVALMLNELSVEEGQKVLDVGCGSGWTTALLSYLVGESGYVYGTELIAELVDRARKSLARLKIENVEITHAQYNTLGIPGKSFDRILVSASSAQVPEDLKRQLKVGGMMLVPVKNSIYKIHKYGESEFESEEFPGYSFLELRR